MFKNFPDIASIAIFQPYWVDVLIIAQFSKAVRNTLFDCGQ